MPTSFTHMNNGVTGQNWRRGKRFNPYLKKFFLLIKCSLHFFLFPVLGCACSLQLLACEFATHNCSSAPLSLLLLLFPRVSREGSLILLRNSEFNVKRYQFTTGKMPNIRVDCQLCHFNSLLLMSCFLLYFVIYILLECNNIILFLYSKPWKLFSVTGFGSFSPAPFRREVIELLGFEYRIYIWTWVFVECDILWWSAWWIPLNVKLLSKHIWNYSWLVCCVSWFIM